METMTRANMIEKLHMDVGPQKVIVEYTSPVSMKKTGNPFKDDPITKTVTLEGTIGKSYESEITSQRRDEGKTNPEDFVVHPRTWGTFVNSYLIEHKGSYYLQVFAEKASLPVYRNGDTIILETVIKPFLPLKKEQEITIRDIKIDNIKKLTLQGVSNGVVYNHEEYELV